MIIAELLHSLNEKISPDYHFKNDPTGLLVGSANNNISAILVALDLTEAVIMEAVAQKCSLIITHHPLFYYPLSNLAAGGYYQDLVLKLLKNNIDLISLHTRLDLLFKDGVSRALAEALHLQDITPLAAASQITEINTRQTVKLAVYTPPDYLKQVKAAINAAGGAVIGNYDNCFFTYPGTGCFRGNADSNPFSGQKTEISSVEEIKLETVVLKQKIGRVLQAVRAVHPYEEPAIDVYDIQTLETQHAFGCIGTLPAKMNRAELIDHCKNSLDCSTIRFAFKSGQQTFHKIALAGGSGAKYWKHARQAAADLYLTSEIDHHLCLEAVRDISLADATHFTTEKFCLNKIEQIISRMPAVPAIHIAQSGTDPFSS